MINNLFVYGTLGPGRPNEHILASIGGSWQEASVKGNLHQKGWGAAMGYPGLVINEEGESIEGFLFSSKNISKHWDELDKFEGERYIRVLTTVSLKNKTIVEAYIYTLKQR